MRKEQGITIISLVITIIVLIVLAGVSINLTLGEDGIITKARQAKENMVLAQAEEEEMLNNLYSEMEGTITTSGNTSNNGEISNNGATNSGSETTNLQKTLDEINNNLKEIKNLLNPEELVIMDNGVFTHEGATNEWEVTPVMGGGYGSYSFTQDNGAVKSILSSTGTSPVSYLTVKSELIPNLGDYSRIEVRVKEFNYTNSGGGSGVVSHTISLLGSNDSTFQSITPSSTGTYVFNTSTLASGRIQIYMYSSYTRSCTIAIDKIVAYK